MADQELILVEKAKQGDRPSFEALVIRTSRSVFAAVYLETGDPHGSEDLVQETFLKAFQSIGQLQDPQGFRGWLLSIARTVAIDSLRRESRKKRSGRKEKGTLLDRLRGRSPEPVEDLETQEMRERALGALRSLPEEYRLPIAMRYLAGADYRTISRQLGMSNGSLRGLLYRGMSALREEMNKTLETGKP